MKYSVLMSVYIEEKPEYFALSLDSMLEQTVKPDEIVLVKDGSLTEELDIVITQYQKQYPTLFKVVSLEKNVGLGLALNEGLKVAKNDLVARMDTDDIALSTRCEKQLQLFKMDPELSIVGTNIDEFSENHSVIHSSRVVPEKHDDIVQFSKKRNPFNHPTVMYKKNDVLESGGYGNFRRNQDYELFVRMLNEGYQAANINESLLLFRANEDNLKRRKSWRKTKNDLKIRYNFWKKGFVGFSDLSISAIGILVAYLAPGWLFERLSSSLLREKKK